MLNNLVLFFMCLFLGLLHLGAGAAFAVYFSWEYLLISLLLWQIFAMLGISVCYHREITHRQYQSVILVRVFHLFCAAIAGQAGPIMWAKVHRIHHRYADTERDPHSPRYGLFRSHLGWLFEQKKRKENSDFQKTFVDIENDPLLLFFQRIHFPFFFTMLTALYCVGGLPWLLWFGCFRITLTLHSAWVINSLGHKWGYKNYLNRDDSRNNKILAFFTAGEGFHNNHHQSPNRANMAHKTGEFDLGFVYILLLYKMGLIRKLKR